MMPLRALGAITCLLLTLLIPATAFAQALPKAMPFVFASGEKISLLPDGSYLLQHNDGKLVFEAQIAPDIRIVDTFGKQAAHVLEPVPSARDAGRLVNRRLFAYSIFGTFLLRVRMLDTESNPVRTPSYMPKATMQFAWLKNLADPNPAVSAGARPTDFNEGPIEMWLVNFIPFGHHSNGQEKCLFLDQERIDGKCQSVGPIPPTGRETNTLDGSFSTNYIRLGLNYRRLYTSGDTPGDQFYITRREWGVGANVELNPTGYVGGSISDQLRPIYGSTRFKLTADMTFRNVGPRRFTCGRAWTNGSVDILRNGPPSVPSAITMIEAGCLPTGWGGSGLFVRWYRGQDYYNAAFQQKINRIQFGITFLQAKFLAFPISPTD